MAETVIEPRSRVDKQFLHGITRNGIREMFKKFMGKSCYEKNYEFQIFLAS